MNGLMKGKEEKP